MRPMSNIEYSLVVHELFGLAGGRLEKIYDMGDGEFRLKIRAPGKSEDISIKLGERLHATKYIRDAPKEPSNLSMFLRKRIAGSRVECITQHGLDRVVVFNLTGEQAHTLVLEMFAEGNLFLLDSTGKILRCLRREEWKDRTLKEGQEYKFPQSERLSPPFSQEQLAGILDSKAIIASLASKTNFGNDYLEEACKRAEIGPREKGNEVESEKLELLAQKLNEIFENPVPLIYTKDNMPFDYARTSLSKYLGLEFREAKSLSEAVDECANLGSDAVSNAPEPEKEKKREKLEKRLALQQEHVSRMLTEAEELKKKGDEIYARYQEVEGILKEIAEMKKSGASWADIKKALIGKCRIDEHSGKAHLPSSSPQK